MSVPVFLEVPIVIVKPDSSLCMRMASVLSRVANGLDYQHGARWGNVRAEAHELIMEFLESQNFGKVQP